MTSPERDRARGCLRGLACGDALGRPVEFKTSEQIERSHGTVTEMLAYGTHGRPAGTITDDTDLALCVAESLVASDGFDPDDVAARFVDWLDAGPFDIGLMTRDAIAKLRDGTSPADAGQIVWESRPEGSNAGNGSVMRCAPYAIAFRNDAAELERVSRASSAITHADPRCTWGCVVLNHTIGGLLRNDPDPLGAALDASTDAPTALLSAIERVHDALDSPAHADALERDLATTGYVVDTLQTGLYCGLTADCAEDAIVDAVNRGGDTDTVGAVTGAIAGARPDTDSLPERWLDEIDERDRLDSLAEALLDVGFESADGDGRRE
ncbi:ADP-ribosylglycohydrolase family protein [Halorubellus sp. JP-L1]|uniref:ADP-ribosylglycohydrolase family protein n=1 Tax=Halorubellus sp. JP-L1 TaxID=2715753 RepID=UPI00140B413B|nr:ADP-ribosylglycohydrolase family protein [Halorubellus sp. JP-L1]NHN42954.1 ADP-ribosylglycohydrolase family protein [Halorubellus sp. JP-L1]